MEKRNSVILLSSGIALGVYTPLLILKHKLDRQNIENKFFVLEDYFNDSKKDLILRNKFLFHNNYSLVLKSQERKIDYSNIISKEQEQYLITEWKKNSNNTFIVSSGFWTPILQKVNKWIKQSNQKIIFLHHDSINSVSWINSQKLDFDFEEVWYYNYDSHSIDYFISIDDDYPQAFADRKHSFFIHGGGWGMGTYRDYIKDLLKTGYYLDILCYHWDEIEYIDHTNSYLIDPSWKSWVKNKYNRHIFPPFLHIGKIKNREMYCSDYPASYEIVRKSKAIVSKPGGGTLIDSFASATPIIFLENCGKHESYNQKLWEDFGFGISIKKFFNEKDKESILKNMHQALINQRNDTKDIMDIFKKS